MKFFGLGGAVVLALILAACQQPVLETNHGSAQGTGSISVSVGDATSGRSLLVSVAAASAQSNWYEVIAYNATNSYFVSSGAGAVGTNPFQSGGVNLNNVVAGTYQVVALAGRSVAEGEVILLGSGMSTVTVSTGGVSPVSVSLTNILWNVYAGGSGTTNPPTNTPFTIQWVYDSGVSVVQPTALTGLTGNQGNNWLARTPATVTGFTPNAGSGTPIYSATMLGIYPGWLSTVTFAGWPTPGSVLFTLGVPVLELHDTANGRSHVLLKNITGTEWMMPNDNWTQFQTLTGITSGVSYTFSAPNIGPTVTWGSGR